MIRYIFLMMLLGGFLMGGSAYAKIVGPEKSSVEQVASETRVYEVFGMDCPGCHGGVEKLLKKIAAVQSVEANWKKKILMVTVKPGETLNDEDVYEAIRLANFSPGKRLQ